MDGGVAAVKQVYERQPEMNTQKNQELEEELVVSKRFTADLMLNINSVEQQVRKYTEAPVISWSDNCECRQNVSAVADLLKKFIIMEDAKKSKPEAVFGTNTRVSCETQTEANSRQRDCANVDEQETQRRLEDKIRELSVLVDEYQSEIALLKEEMENMLQDQQQNKRSDHTGRRPEKVATVSSWQTNATALTDETSGEKEICHPACNKHRPRTKGIILSHWTFTNIPEHETSVSSGQTKDTALTEIFHSACKTEIYHPACNKHRPGTKRIILSHQTFTNIPEHGTSASS
jgi:hypothetical protein